MSDDPEKKSMVSEVGGWIWGTIKGGFNEQQSVSQIIVDAAIGMIPVVGDVTAVRDLIAVILRLVEDPKKREDKLEWLTLVLLLFALIPVAGGVVKGVGQLLIKAGEDLGRHAELVRDIIQFLNRIGEGNAVKFLKELNFEAYTGELTGQWRKLTQRLDDVIGAILRRGHSLMPDSMVARLQHLQESFRQLKNVGERMIPDSLKDLNRRLKSLQQHIYSGEWHEISGGLNSATREAEARLIEKEKDGKKVKEWELKNSPHPPCKLRDFEPVEGWPNLSRPPWVDEDSAWAIASFSGKIRPVKIPPGTKIRRVVTDSSRKAGRFWSFELARDGVSWRKDCAVLENWSKNGHYVELVVPEPGLWAWEGRIASQVENDVTKETFGQVLPGGATQLLIDFEMSIHQAAKRIVEDDKLVPRIPTHWSGLAGVNVPDKVTTVQKLAAAELEPKRRVHAAAAAAQRAVRGADQQGNDRSQPEGRQ
jgi:hypothetical protein